MFKNYLKVAWRNLIRKKVFSFINIFGLATGLAIFTLISLYVLDELSYDRYNENASQIYRVNTNIKINGSEFNDKDTPAPMADALVKTYPRVEQAVRISAAYQGDRHPQSAGVKRKQHNRFSIQRFYQACRSGHYYCNAPGLVGNEQMAAKFCIQDKHQLVDIFHSRSIGIVNCLDHNQFPGSKGSGC